MVFEQGSLICCVALTFTANITGRTVARIGGAFTNSEKPAWRLCLYINLLFRLLVLSFLRCFDSFFHN